MPTYKIRAPNGKTYRITGPAGASDAQIRAQVLRQFPEAGQAPEFDVTPEQARQALGRGRAALERQTAGMSAEQRRRAQQRYDSDPRVRSLRDRADNASLGDLGRATANVGARGVQGIISPFTFLEDTAKTVQQGVNYGVTQAGSGLLGAMGLDDAAKWWERGGGEVHRQIVQRPTVHSVIESVVPRPTDRAGRIASTVAEIGGGMMIPFPTPKAPIRAPIATAVASNADDIVRAGQREGVRVMTSDVRPPRTFIGQRARAVGERIPWAGTGGPRAAQQQERVEAVTNLLRDFGGDDVVQLFDDAPSAVDDVARSLTAQRGRELTRLTNAKKGIIARHSGAGEVPVANTLQAIDDQIAELTRRGTKPALEVVDDLRALRTSIQGKTLDQLEAIRADELSNAFKGGNTLADVRVVGEKAIRAIYDPLRRDMGEFITQRGGAADAKTWRTANERLAAMAGELDSSTFKNVLRNTDLTPEAVGRLLFSRNRSDVARLYANLDAPGKARAQAAVLQRAFDKAISADQGLSVERFVNNLSQMGDSVGVVFQGDDLARVQGMSKLLDATRRAAEARVMPPTGIQNTPVVEGFTLGSLFGWGAIPVAGGGGLLARAYESAPVRNLLLRLGRAKAGSAAEGKLVDQLSKLIVTTVVSQRQRIGSAANDEIPAALAAQEQENDGNQ